MKNFNLVGLSVPEKKLFFYQNKIFAWLGGGESLRHSLYSATFFVILDRKIYSLIPTTNLKGEVVSKIQDIKYLYLWKMATRKE